MAQLLEQPDALKERMQVDRGERREALSGGSCRQMYIVDVIRTRDQSRLLNGGAQIGVLSGEV
jgi:hypothetical protein